MHLAYKGQCHDLPEQQTQSAKIVAKLIRVNRPVNGCDNSAEGYETY